MALEARQRGSRQSLDGEAFVLPREKILTQPDLLVDQRHLEVGREELRRLRGRGEGEGGGGGEGEGRGGGGIS